MIFFLIQFGTFISQEKTKQALETIQSVLVEKLDKRFDQVEVSMYICDAYIY